MMSKYTEALLADEIRSLQTTVEVMRQEAEGFARRTTTLWGRLRFVVTGR